MSAIETPARDLVAAVLLAFAVAASAAVAGTILAFAFVYPFLDF